MVITVLLEWKTEKLNSQCEHGQLMEQTRGLFCMRDAGVASCHSQHFWQMNSLFEAYCTGKWVWQLSIKFMLFMRLWAQWLSGRVLDSRPKGRGFEPHRRHCVVSLSKNINPSLVLVQPRKTRPFITERLLMGRKESNQTKKSWGYERLQKSKSLKACLENVNIELTFLLDLEL